MKAWPRILPLPGLVKIWMRPKPGRSYSGENGLELMRTLRIDDFGGRLLANLVGALVEVTRVEGDPSSRGVEDVDLDRLVRALLEAGRMEADARGSRFQFVSDGALLVRGDRELLRRAIENVSRNAVRYAPESSPIEVKLESAAGQAANFGARLRYRSAGRDAAQDLSAVLSRG